MSTQQRAVDVAGDVAFACQRVDRGINTRCMHKGGNEPISYQYDRYHRNLRPKFFARSGEYKGGKHPGQADTSQHAGPAQGLKLELQQAAAYQTQKHQDEASAQNLQVYTRHGFSFLLLLLEREGEGYARNKEEQRENSVMMYQPIPGHMFHLRSYGLPHGRIWEKSSNGRNQRSTASNEEHVEASECI